MNDVLKEIIKQCGFMNVTRDDLLNRRGLSLELIDTYLLKYARGDLELEETYSN